MGYTPITVTYSLEEMFKEINAKLDKIGEKFEAKLDTFQKEMSDFRTETQVAIESLTGEIKTLDAEVKGINQRLDPQELINCSICIGFIIGWGQG